MDVRLQKYLRNALQGVARLRSQVDILTRENDQLKADLDRLYEAQDISIQPKRGKARNVSVLSVSLTAQVNKLKRDVADLEHVRMLELLCKPHHSHRLSLGQKKRQKEVAKSTQGALLSFVLID